jgi:5-formyltetrahydrofolate cyclo-ligase
MTGLIAAQKSALRTLMKERRALLFEQHPEAGDKIAALFFDFFDFPPQNLLGAYWPLGSEFEIRPLLHKLIEKGFRCALPCIIPEGIVFRLWDPSVVLVKGAFQTLEPAASSPVVVPSVLLVPLLAFDGRGNRLGYGRGHYDDYLHQHTALTIGVGFKGQEVENVPHKAHDVPVDYILTEEGIESFS